MPGSPFDTTRSHDGADSSVTADFLPRQSTEFPSVPRYTIVRELGQGGMGVVYEAINSLGVSVALKIIRPNRLTEHMRLRFRQEAKSMMELDHPNLARIYEFGEFDGGPYLTMRLLTGHTFGDILSSLHTDPLPALQHFLPVLEAFAYLHAHNKVHRDVKPGNILVDNDGKLYVSDFGLVKELTDGMEVIIPSSGSDRYAGSLTKTGAKMGTRAYMSPEQEAGDHKKVGPPTDVWALGLILAEISFGARPTRNAFGEPSFPPTSNEQLGPIKEVITKCLKHEPGDRYRNAQELYEALHQALSTVGVSVGPLPPPPVAPRSTGWWPLVAVAALLMVSVIIWKAISPPPPPTIVVAPETPAAVDPHPELTAIFQELDEKGEVDLLDDKGRLRFMEWMTGESVWHEGPHPLGPPDAKGWLEAGKNQVLMMELFRDGKAYGYRFVVEMAHVNNVGEGGIYAGRSVQPHEKRGPTHCFMGITMTDIDSILLRVCAAFSCPVVKALGTNRAVPIGTDRRPNQKTGQWETLTQTLDQSSYTASTSQKTFGTIARNQLLEKGGARLGFAHDGAGGMVPTFAPHDGFGLWVDDRAVICVRSIKMAKLSAPKTNKE